MKTVILKVNDTSQTIAEHDIVVNDGQPTVVDAMQNVNYELVDLDTGNAPESIFTRRQANDLYITMDNSERQSDLIIIGYYDSVGNEVIGLAEDGSYYHYVPVNDQVDSFIATLDESEAKSQKLGGQLQTSPWWVGASDISVITDTVLAADSEATINSLQAMGQPVNVALVVLGVASMGIVMSHLSDDDSSKDDSSKDDSIKDVVENDNSAPVAPSINITTADAVIIPNDHTVMMTVNYVNADAETVQLNITKDTDSEVWTTTDALPMGATLEAATGQVTLSIEQLDKMSAIGVTAKNEAGATVKTTVMGEGDDTVELNQISADFIDGGTGLDTLDITLSDVVATNDNLLNVAGFEIINIKGDNAHYNIDSTSFVAGDDNKTFINNTGESNVIDLGNNNSDTNNIDLGNWSQSDSNTSVVDAAGNTHLYNIYTDGTDMLYIQTDITVI